PAGTGLGAVMFVSTYAYLALMVGLMMTFFAVRHSRGDEDAGRAELVRGTAVGRWAPLASTLLAGAVELAIVCGLTLAVSVALGLPATGSALMALALAGVGLIGMLVGLLAGQVLPTSRAANGAAAIVVGAWFFVRGIGDALGEPSDDLTRVESAWPAWLSPIGWGAQAHPFADAPWEPDGTPLLLFVPAALLLGGLVAALESRRELGSALVAERHG
ncbi:polyketide antibiotic transporter, partial [Agrococcus sp. HG114]|nr:polyketide antibiotic transporter [Agrococcus sp. HG114]